MRKSKFVVDMGAGCNHPVMGSQKSLKQHTCLSGNRGRVDFLYAPLHRVDSDSLFYRRARLSEPFAVDSLTDAHADEAARDEGRLHAGVIGCELFTVVTIRVITSTLMTPPLLRLRRAPAVRDALATNAEGWQCAEKIRLRVAAVHMQQAVQQHAHPRIRATHAR
ncbi:MAG: hypothetical protein ABI870_09405 [Rhodanobacter sp.]